VNVPLEADRGAITFRFFSNNGSATWNGDGNTTAHLEAVMPMIGGNHDKLIYLDNPSECTREEVLKVLTCLVTTTPLKVNMPQGGALV